MRVADVQRQFRYWGRFPPVRDMIAAYLGIDQKTSASESKPMSEEDYRQAFLMHGVVNGQ